MGTGSLLPGVKRPGRGVDNPPSSSAEVKGKNKEIPLLPLWAFTACSKMNFTFSRLLRRTQSLPSCPPIFLSLLRVLLSFKNFRLDKTP